MKIRFTKMHGLGNDFVIIDASKQNIELTPQMVRQIADRHFGIGCDQVILLTTPNDIVIDIYYRIFNADGSEAGQSGNGARCVAKYISNRLLDKNIIVMQTPTRVINATIEPNGLITVCMGTAELSPAKIPFLAMEQSLSYNINTPLGTFLIGAVSVGNPHAVIKVTDVENIDVENIGKTLSKHSQFPEGANVNFMQVIDRSKIKLRTYERGSGETLACGSGACAAVVIGRLWKLLDEQVTVCLHGGNLVINCSDVMSPIAMLGPAAVVFTGEFEIKN